MQGLVLRLFLYEEQKSNLKKWLARIWKLEQSSSFPYM